MSDHRRWPGWKCDGVVAGQRLPGGESHARQDADSAVVDWNGIAFRPLASGVNHAISAFKGQLYVGGRFTAAGEVKCKHRAKWDGRHWTAPNPLWLDDYVLTMLAGDDYLYLGGRFVTAGDGTVLQHIDAWDGANWLPLGDGATYDR